jgi:Zn-dependent oligopeptidase
VASVFESINDILFSEELKPTDSKIYEIDPEKVADFNDNYLFNKFHHLFEYDATYYSYLLAKIASQKLYSNEVNPVNSDENLTVSNQIHSLFEKGAMYDARDIASK